MQAPVAGTVLPSASGASPFLAAKCGQVPKQPRGACKGRPCVKRAWLAAPLGILWVGGRPRCGLISLFFPPCDGKKILGNDRGSWRIDKENELQGKNKMNTCTRYDSITMVTPEHRIDSDTAARVTLEQRLDLQEVFKLIHVG